MIRNVIFDWSGTLVDDLPAVWQAVNHLFAKAGVAPMTLDRFRDDFELPARAFFARHLSGVPAVPERQLQQWFAEKFLELESTVVALPHAREFLEFARREGLRTFVLSAVPAPWFARQAAATGLGEFLQHHCLGADDKRDLILGLLAEHRLDPAETVFVGDMRHDLETARHGGIAGIAVLTGYNRLEQLRAAEPDLVVEHLGELRGLLERNGLRLRARDAAKRFPIPTVGALVFDDAGRVLMLRTDKWSGLWGIPGGKIEWGEAAIDALHRELLEETGLEVDDVRFVLVQDAVSPPEFYKDAHFLLLNYTCRAAGSTDVALNDEAQEFRWVTPAQARALPLNTPTRILLDAVSPVTTPNAAADQAAAMR